MTATRSFLALAFNGVLVFSSSVVFGNDIQKLNCKEVEGIEAKCQAYDSETKACETQTQDEGKAQIDAAKKEQDECKKKHGLNAIVKCKAEIKKATTLVNLPKPLLKQQIQKDLVAKPDSACAKAEAIGKEQVLCKGPKQVVAALKANCIKDK